MNPINEYNKENIYPIRDYFPIEGIHSIDYTEKVISKNKRKTVNYYDHSRYYLRKDHEDIIRNSIKCQELGLDQNLEIEEYLKKWGSFIEE